MTVHRPNSDVGGLERARAHLGATADDPTTRGQRHQARLVCADHAHDAADLATLLDMLGLLGQDAT